jgi:hypothetical protein
MVRYAYDGDKGNPLKTHKGKESEVMNPVKKSTKKVKAVAEPQAEAQEVQSQEPKEAQGAVEVALDALKDMAQALTEAEGILKGEGAQTKKIKEARRVYIVAKRKMTPKWRDAVKLAKKA